MLFARPLIHTAYVFSFLLPIVMAGGQAFAQDKTITLPRGVPTPRSAIYESSQDFCSACQCCKKVNVFDAKQMLKMNKPKDIESMVFVIHTKNAKQVNDIITKHPAGSTRDATLLRWAPQDLCESVPCLKKGPKILVDWAAIKSDPRLIDAMQAKGYVILPKN